MAFDIRHSPIGSFDPTTEQRRNQNQRVCPHKMQQQHNTLSSILLEKKTAHGGVAALRSLVTRSVAADPVSVSMPPYSSSWASPLLAANHGTFFESDRCPPPPSLSPMPICAYYADSIHVSSYVSYAPIYMGARVHEAQTSVYMHTAHMQQIYS